MKNLSLIITFVITSIFNFALAQKKTLVTYEVPKAIYEVPIKQLAHSEPGTYSIVSKVRWSIYKGLFKPVGVEVGKGTKRHTWGTSFENQIFFISRPADDRNRKVNYEANTNHYSHGMKTTSKKIFIPNNKVLVFKMPSGLYFCNDIGNTKKSNLIAASSIYTFDLKMLE